MSESVRYVVTSCGVVAWRVGVRGLLRCCLPQPDLPAALAAVEAATGELDDGPVARSLAAYYRGEAVDLNAVALELPGETEFQAAVRAVVRAIPRGGTMSYGQVAAAAGRPGAARAVGRVMATNPLPPFIPCHRVLAADGRLGGYGGGLALKQRLLDQEGQRCEGSSSGGSARR